MSTALPGFWTSGIKQTIEKIELEFEDRVTESIIGTVQPGVISEKKEING